MDEYKYCRNCRHHELVKVFDVFSINGMEDRCKQFCDRISGLPRPCVEVTPVQIDCPKWEAKE